VPSNTTTTVPSNTATPGGVATTPTIAPPLTPGANP
jgi:hypothetical protein